MADQKQQIPGGKAASRRIYADALEAEIDGVWESFNRVPDLDYEAKQAWATLNAAAENVSMKDAPRELQTPMLTGTPSLFLGGQDTYPQDPSRLVPAISTPRRQSTVYNNRSFVGPAYADPELVHHRQSDCFSTEGKHSHGHDAPINEPMVWQRKKAYGRPKPQMADSTESFSSYKNGLSQTEYPTERCIELGCWQKEPHTHDGSERPLTTPSRKRATRDCNLVDDEERPRGPKIARMDMEAEEEGRQGISIRKSLLDMNSRSTGHLKKALPSIDKHRVKFMPSAEQIRISSGPVFALPIRPASLGKPLRKEGMPPVPKLERARFSVGPLPPKNEASASKVAPGNLESRTLARRDVPTQDSGPTSEEIPDLLATEAKLKESAKSADEDDEDEMPEL